MRGRGHPHKYPQPLRTSHLFTLVFEWGGRKGGGDNVQEAHGQGTGNSWLLLPRPAIESRPQDLLHPPSCAHQGTTRLESPGCVHQRGSPGWGQTAGLKKRPQYKESQPWQARTWPSPPPISEQRGRLFAASQRIRKGPKGAGSHILRGSHHCSSGVNSPGANIDHRM